MDSFELNKIIGALLAVVFVIFSVNLISHAVFSSPAPETPGYAIAVPEDGGAEEAEGEAEPESVLPLLASADASAGESVFKRCQACHSVEQGGPNKVGPNLWNVVNRPVASHEGFSYSSAMQEFSQGGEVTWTYENLDHFLTDPRGFVKGTAMAFAGLANVEDRANVIAYLRSMSDDPAPLPEAASEESGAAEGADGGAPDEAAAPEEAGGTGGEAAGEAAAPEEGAASTDSASGTEPAGDGAEDTGDGAPAPAEDAANGDSGSTDPSGQDAGEETGTSGETNQSTEGTGESGDETPTEPQQ